MPGDDLCADADAEIAARLAKRASTSTEQLLNERGKTHGDFAIHAGCTQALKAVIVYWTAQAGKRPTDLDVQQREALDMIVHKIGRIVAGDPDFQDHWDDISGYAMLVSKALVRATTPGGKKE